MLVENRRRRSVKPSGHLNTAVPQSIASSSRYNPIFIETDPAVRTSEAADTAPASDFQQPLPASALNQNNVTPLPGNTVDSEPTHAPVLNSSNSKPKLKARTQVVPRKSSSLILKPWDANVMPKKPASGSASTAGTSKKSSLDPWKCFQLLEVLLSN
ncbi:hypothetical protein V6N13_001333 [Hibiscus sabdariffa]